MARGVNKVILIGNLGADPETRYTANGSAVTTVSLATTEAWKDKNTGEQQERTEWHRVVFFNRLAEIVQQYLKKGAKLYVEGSIRTNKWQDKDGNDRYTTEILGNEMQMLDGRGGNHSSFDNSHYNQSQNQNQNNYNQSQNYNQNQPTQNSAPQQSTQPAAATHNSSDQFDDDIPF